MMVGLIIKSIPDIVFIILLLIISLGIGNSIWALLFEKSADPQGLIEEGIFSISLGLGVLCLFILLIGVLGFLNLPGVLLIFFLSLLFTFRNIKSYFLNLFTKTNDFFSSPMFRSSLFWILSPVLITGFLFLFLFSRIPPVFYDALVYHLGIPNQYIIQGTIRFIPNSFHSNHPFLIQNIFTVCLLMGGYKTPKLLVLVFSILTAIALSLFAVRLYKRPISWLAGLLLFLTPTMLIISSLVNVDSGFSLYTLLAFYSLCMWANKEKPCKNNISKPDNHLVKKKGGKVDWLILSGILTGLALGTKYTAIIYCLGICTLCIFFVLIKGKKKFNYITKTLIVYLTFAILFGSAWYIRNLFWTGNPFYPKWAHIWGNPKISQYSLRTFNQSARAYNPSDPSSRHILLLPLDIIIHPERFGVGGNIGPLFLLLLLLSFFPDRKNPLYYFVISYCALYFLAWGFTFRMTRFAIPLFSLIILLGTGTLDTIYNSRYKQIRFLVIIVLLIGLFYNICYSVSLFTHIYDPWNYLSGKETQEQYLSRKIPSYPVFDYINRNLKKDSIILFVGETASFYCFRQVIAPTAFDSNPFISILKASKTNEDIIKALKELGITHFLINFYEMDRLEKGPYKPYRLEIKDKILMDAFLKASTILFKRKDIILFQV